MLLRFFMGIMKPSDDLLRRRKRDGCSSFRVNLYQSVLRRLLRTYSHYAMSDTIIIGDKMQVVHEYRDPEFERELQRNRIDYRLKMQTASLPLRTYKSTRTSHFSFFRFASVLKLSVDGKEWSIKHDDAVSFEGHQKSKLKCTSGLYGLQQALVDITPALPKKKEQRTQTIHDRVNVRQVPVEPVQVVKPKRKPVKKVTSGLFEREKKVLQKTVTETEDAGKYKEQEIQQQVISKRGFDIDSSF